MENLRTFEEYDEDWGGSDYELKSSKKIDKKIKKLDKEDKKSQKKLKKLCKDAALRMILY